MSTAVKRTLFWAPRVLCILVALFLSLFALDVFGEGYGFWGTAVALVIHLVPVYLVAAALALAWRWEWVGGVLCVGLALAYGLSVYFGKGPEARWDWYACISGPLLLVGGLFLLNWWYRDQLRASSAEAGGAP